MSAHAKKAMLENLHQNLLELMADFLSNDSTKLDMAIAEIEEIDQSNESELHIRMADAALSVFRAGTRNVPDWRNFTEPGADQVSQ